MTWENAPVDRLPGRRVSLQVELHPSGDSVFRYDFRDALEPPATNFVMGAQMETDGVNALSIFGTNVIAATVWNVEGEPVADGVSIADLLCTNGVLRTPATFEIRWKNTTGLDPDADTDGDGLTDWTETFLWGTAPDCSDTDGDGIADSVELMMGMNQFDADEDGDGIPDGAAEEDWPANPLWAANATNGVNVVISLNEAVPANAAATLVVGDLAIPLRSPASWTLAFVPGIAYDYRLHVSGDVPVNLSITAGAPPSDLLNAPRPPAAGDADDNDGPPLWEHGKGGVFDGESPGGDGKVAIADISFTWGPSSGETHLTGYGICLHEGSRAGFEPHAVPSEIDEKWELTNLLMENGLFFLDVPNPGAVYTGTASLQSDLLREGRLSADFAAHRCDATSSRPFCSVCSCYVPLDAELICYPRRLTLKYDNFAELSMLHNNSTNVGFSNPRYEIKGPGDTTWTSLPGDNWKARIGGTFLVRGVKVKFADKPEANEGNGIRFNVIRSFDPDAQVEVVDGLNEPNFANLTTSEIKQYLRDRYQGREVTINSDGTIVEFTRDGLTSALKKRDKHRRVLHVLDELVEKSHFTRYEDNDGQKKHAHLNGQFVYTAAIRLSDGVYGIELKLDDPILSDNARFKGQTLKTKIADASLSTGPRSVDPLSVSDNGASAVERIRLGDFVPTPRNMTDSTAKVNGESETHELHNKNGTIVGEYDRAANEVTLYPGATVSTVAHEIGWHATYKFAEDEASGKEITVGPITIWVRFPSETEMIADPAIQAKAAELWSQTLNACTPTSRREFGCWIRLDTGTDTYEFFQTICGDEVSDNRPTGIQLDTPPPDTPIFPHLSHGSAIYTVGSLHTHTPTTYLQEDDPRPAGPSVPDKMTSRSLHMPGIVYDYDEETTGAGIPMGLSMDATAHLYPAGVCPRRNQ